ncbi:MAG: hypothetical protein HOO90_00010, partial [Methylotenera sp.]|uniref:SpvB/TcaC N-terminal domain-containing protein n=1 Tax=Methylotenera sp. TaxID=2051956 RepID=UPI0017C5A967
MIRHSTLNNTQSTLLMTLMLMTLTMTANAATPFTTNGNFSIGSDGSANYSIPIQVPPGTAGMAPTLSLNYNSNGGNGILGMGWGLDGLSQISRCPKTIIQDGAVGGVNYDATDKICIDGQRLISTGGTYAGLGTTEYRTESANFAKIISYTTTVANGPDYFKVWTKAGQVIEYGNTADSRIEAAAKTVVRSWGVNKISDTKGNYITVTYVEDNPNGEAYVSRVDYTGNASATPALAPYASVQFSYEARPDPSTGYHAGSVMKSTKRMTNIKTYMNTTLVKDYRLTYEQGTATQRSRLKTLTECDGNTTTPTCLQAVGLGWQTDSQIGVSKSDGYSNSLTDTYFSGSTGDMGTQMIDINGDGLVDIVQLYLSLNGAYGNVPQRRVFLNNGNTFVKSDSYSNSLTDTYFSGSTGDMGTQMIDINGDGLVDIVQLFLSPVGWYAGVPQRRVYLNTGSSFIKSDSYTNSLPDTYITGGSGTNMGTQLMDVNGDGLADIVQLFLSPVGWYAGVPQRR